MSSENEEASQNIKQEIRTRPKQNKFSQDCGRKRQLKDDLPPEIRAAQRQMDDAFDYIKKRQKR